MQTNLAQKQLVPIIQVSVQLHEAFAHGCIPFSKQPLQVVLSGMLFPPSVTGEGPTQIFDCCHVNIPARGRKLELPALIVFSVAWEVSLEPTNWKEMQDFTAKVATKARPERASSFCKAGRGRVKMLKWIGNLPSWTPSCQPWLC